MAFVADNTCKGLSLKMRKAERAEVYRTCREKGWPFVEVLRTRDTFCVEGNSDPLIDKIRSFDGVRWKVEVAELFREQIKDAWQKSDLTKSAQLNGWTHHLFASGFKNQKDARRLATLWFDGWIDAAEGHLRKHILTTINQKENSMVKFFRDGKTLALQTDAGDERLFTQDFAIALQDFMASPQFEGMHQVETWLKSYAEICCKMRGYKADVKEQRLLTVGDIQPASETLINVAEHGTQSLKAVA
jgi:hypothetical protein